MILLTRFMSLTALAAASVLALTPGSADAFVGERIVSPGGIEAWYLHAPDVPVISFKFSFRGGSALDPDGKEGLADFVSVMLDEGAADLDSRAFQGLLTENSIGIGFNAYRDGFSGSLYMMSADADLGFELLSKALNAPRFDEEPMERMRRALIAGLRSGLQDPSTLASLAWFATAFPDHPYGRPVSGTLDTIATITADDLRGFVEQRFARNNLVIGVVGDIDQDALGAALDTVFGDLPAEATSWELPPVEMQGQGEIVIVDVDLAQSVFLFGQPGPVVDSDQYHPVNVVNRILGGSGFSSRLYEEIREQRGLTYGVATWLQSWDQAGMIMGQTSTINQRAAETLEVLLAEWEKMAVDGPTDSEVEDARTYVNGSYPLRYDNTSSIASALRTFQELELPIDYYHQRPALVDAVSLEVARQTASDWLDPSKLLIVIAGNPEGIEGGRIFDDEAKQMIGLPSAE